MLGCVFNGLMVDYQFQVFRDQAGEVVRALAWMQKVRGSVLRIYRRCTERTSSPKHDFRVQTWEKTCGIPI